MGYLDVCSLLSKHFPVIFSLACIPWPRQWSLQSCPFPIFPNPELPAGWGVGSAIALADGFSSSLQHLPRPPTHLPSPLSSVSGHLQALGQSHPFPWGSRQTVSHLLDLGHCHPWSSGPCVAVASSQKQRMNSDKKSKDLRVVWQKKNFNFFLFCGCFNFNQPSFPPFLLLLLLLTLFLLLLLEKSQNWELHPLIDGARSKPTSTPTIPSPYMSPWAEPRCPGQADRQGTAVHNAAV